LVRSGGQDMSDLRAAVLVVEDEAIIRLAALDLIESAGYEAVEAKNADEAICILETRPDIRVVFTDIDMPGTMDGLKLAHFIRNRWPPIRIVVASGMKIVTESQLPTGARFFSKPYADGSIVSALAELLNDSQLDRSTGSGPHLS
jgi:two-component system, response regulator PdtaR